MADPTPVPTPPAPPPTPVTLPFDWRELVRVAVYAVLGFLAARYGLPAPQINVVAADGQPAPIVSVQPK